MICGPLDTTRLSYCLDQSPVSPGSRHTPGQSADWRDRQLLADPLRQAIVDFGVTGKRRFWSRWQVIEQFMPLQARSAPTWTESGTSPIKSACAVASGLGAGSGIPSSRRHWAGSSMALAIISRAPAKSNPCVTRPENRGPLRLPSPPSCAEGGRRCGSGAYAHHNCTG